MDVPQLVQRGRDAYARRAWREAYESLLEADREQTLAPQDSERLATAAYLVGEFVHASERWSRAHQDYLGAGDARPAVRCAFWLAFALLHKGERARASGWLARAQRLLDAESAECVERGYLLLPLGMRYIGEGDVHRAAETFVRAAEFGTRFADPDLNALALHCRGRVLIRQGKVDEGVTLLDEAMVAIDAGEVSPIVAGDVYCSVIEGCLEVFDLRRAQEWTTALTQWCEAQPDLAPYRGQCMSRRAELMQLHGDWRSALEEVGRACEWLTRPPAEPAAGAAFYLQGELHRLRGEFAEAEEAYREAERRGRKPYPGMAQLRLAQGRTNDAAAAIRQCTRATADSAHRARLLYAYVEIMLAAHEMDAAREAAGELADLAKKVGARLLYAIARQAEGAVLRMEGDPQRALATLRDAWSAWQELDAPYEAARTRVLIALALQELGDTDGAQLEIDAARATFEQLGAAPDLAMVAELADPGEPDASTPLTQREVQVLRLVARGKTNRSIAGELHISEKTVARHVSNIFLKLDISSRAAATAYAYEQSLV